MKNKNFQKIGIIYFVAMVLIATIFMLGYFGVLTNDILTTFLIQVVVMFAVPLVLYTAFVSKNVKTTFADAGFKKISFKTVLISLLLGVVLYFINSYVASAFSTILSLFGYENLASSTTVKLNYAFLIKDFILTAVMPGIFEEFLHRGILLNAGRKATGNTRYCLIISSILFGLMHLNINQFFYAAILGALMGFVAIKADSIYPTIIIHFMNNFLNSYFLYGVYLNWPFARFVNTLRNVLFGNALVFILTASIGVILLILLYFYLVKIIANERVKRDVKKLLLALELNNLTIVEAQAKIEQANIMLNELQQAKTLKNTSKFNFYDNVFIIACYVLGGLITLGSFIGGII